MKITWGNAAALVGCLVVAAGLSLVFYVGGGEAYILFMVVAAPGRLVTDCHSCRIQFQQVLPFDVAHPVELLWEGYRGFRPVASEMAAPIVGSAVA